MAVLGLIMHKKTFGVRGFCRPGWDSLQECCLSRCCGVDANAAVISCMRPDNYTRGVYPHTNMARLSHDQFGRSTFLKMEI